MFKKRRQRYIHDRRKKKENALIEMNVIYKSFELIGLYDLYSGPDESFHKFYEENTQIRKYKFRNHGIDVIYDLLDNEGQLAKNAYFISKKSIRQTGIHISTVRVYEGTELFVNRMIKFFNENKFLGNFYKQYIHSCDISEYLSFQHDYIMDYCGKNGGGNAKYFGKMDKKIGEIING